MIARQAIVAALSLLVVAGCSSGKFSLSKTGASSRTAKVSTPRKPAPNLKTQLLTVSDLPTGWAVDNSKQSDTVAPSCLKNLHATTQTDDKAIADFIRGPNFPTLSQSVSYYGPRATAVRKFVAGAALMDACTDISISTNGHKATGSIGAMSFPKVGERSKAWIMTLSAEGISVGFDVLFVQKSSEIEVLVYGDLGTVDIDTFKKFVDAAVAKMH